jgi:hypothetical protein
MPVSGMIPGYAATWAAGHFILTTDKLSLSYRQLIKPRRSVVGEISNPSGQRDDRIDDVMEVNEWPLKPESKFWKRYFPRKSHDVLTVARR